MDEIDRANDEADKLEAIAINAVRAKAANIPAGNPGVCDECEEYKERLVGGMCGRCRDEEKFIKRW